MQPKSNNTTPSTRVEIDRAPGLRAESVGSDSHKIASRLEDYLDADYFAGAIRDVYALINHARFLEKQVASLKETVARLQDEDLQEG